VLARDDCRPVQEGATASLNSILPLHGPGAIQVPLSLIRKVVSGELALPQFANSLQHFVEALIEADPKSGKKIKTRSTSTRFDGEGRVDLHQATEVVSVLVEDSQPKWVTEKVLDIGPTIRARRSRNAKHGERPPLIRVDIEGRKRFPTFMPS
jgi:hypothetical protein